MLHHIEVSVDEQLSLSSKFKKNLNIALIVGVLLFTVGVLFAMFGGHGHEVAEASEGSHGHGPSFMMRIWAVLWQNAIFFTGISAMGLFFVCVQYVAWAGWSSVLKRIPEAMGAFIPVGGAIIVVIFLANYFLGHHDLLFHWLHHGIMEKGSENYDSIIAGKAAWLNLPFYLGRMIAFFGLWYFVWSKIRSYSLQEDLTGGESFYHKSGYLSAVFIIIFAVTTPMAAWDWIMSIDTHWFSTMFGWYVFASWWVTGLSTICLICVFLKENGYLKAMNMNHFHDLGKFMFAFSIFWTYIWFSQFLLIFYANLPEETVYFIDRIRGFDGKYTFLLFFNLFINFAFPFLALMTRDAKRQLSMLKVVTIAIIIGHWFDFYLMIMPGTTKGTSDLGLIELGTAISFGTLFIMVVTNSLTKAKLIPANHPFLKEAIQHNI
ncbi:MAG: quinol:cytochrome C oxidoreductase [Cytophagales bacterium]|nr:MAG: quinol:cytochrome C oxidoreductase [Cytophagales bacterium]